MPVVKESIIEQIKNKQLRSCAILTHDNPDADAIGSAVALEQILLQSGKNKVVIITQNKISKTYSEILGKDRVDRINIPSIRYDIVFVLDCSYPERVRFDYRFLGNNVVVIDHHAGYKPYGKVYWCKKVPSTTLMIYELAKELNIQITPLLATSIYLGIDGDTLNFRTPNVTADTHRIVADLIECGADITLVHKIERIRKNVFDLLIKSWPSLMIDKQYKILWMTVTHQEIDDTKTDYSEVTSIIDILKTVQDMNVVLLFVVNGSKIYIQARSNTIDISKVLGEFNGGGHKYAAGGMCYSDSTYSTINRVVKFIKEEIDSKKS